MKGSPAVLSLSDEERRRVEEVDRLTASGAVGVARLIEMLGDRSWTVRRAVIAGLGALGEPAVAPLCAFVATRRDDESALAAAVDALVASTGPVDAAVAALVKGKGEGTGSDVRPAIAADVAQVLGRRRSSAELPTLIALAAHADDNVAVAAMEALGKIGGRAAIETLIAAVASGSFFRTFPAIDVLGRSGDPRAVVCLAELLSNPRYLIEAAHALGRTGDKAAVGPLGALLSSPADAEVRLGAAALADVRRRYCVRCGSPDAIDEALRGVAGAPAVVRRLGAALAAGDERERAAIAVLLGFGDPAAAAPILIDLIGAVDDASELGRVAVESLRRMGPAGEAEIARALRTGDSRRRAALLPLVHRVSASAEVLACLGDAAPAVRAAACDALGRLGNPAVTPSLVALLDDRDPRVVQAATSGLQALGGTETLRLAIEAAAAPSAAVRRAAVRVLGYLGYEAALPVVLGALGDVDPRVRDSAVNGLAYFDEAPALQALLTALRAPAPERMRSAAARALGQRAAAEPPVVQALVTATDDGDPWVRYYACQSLGKLAGWVGEGDGDGDGAGAAAEAIARRLDDPAAQVRLGAIEALAHFSIDSGQRALERAARSDDADTRRAALIGLGLGGRRTALPILIDATASDDAATRLVAFSALASFEPRAGDAPGDAAPDAAMSASIVHALVAGAADPDETVRRSALRCLGTRGDATPALLALLQAAPDDADVQAALSVPSPRRIAELEAALRGADDELGPHLAWALARMRTPTATAALIDTLANAGSPAARKAAAPALAMLAGDDARRVLRQAAARDPDPEVRRVSALLLIT